MTRLEPPDDQPISYLVSDIGQHGVPVLTAKQQATIDTIRMTHKSATLRFVLLPGQFVVFDATIGPCHIGPLYEVLSEPREHYEPGEDPSKVFPDPGA
jgi:hypothetical protein